MSKDVLKFIAAIISFTAASWVVGIGFHQWVPETMDYPADWWKGPMIVTIFVVAILVLIVTWHAFVWVACGCPDDDDDAADYPDAIDR